MANHVFHPSTTLASSVQKFAAGLAAHKADYGTPPESAPADLKPLVTQAKALEPLAQKIADLELELAIAREKYNKKAIPLWNAFAPKLNLARSYAKLKKLDALNAFLSEFSSYVHHHAAAAKAGAPGVEAPPGS